MQRIDTSFAPKLQDWNLSIRWFSPTPSTHVRERILPPLQWWHKLNQQPQPTILKIFGVIPISEVLSLCEMNTASSKNLTRHPVSISYDDKRYVTIATSCKSVCVYFMSYNCGIAFIVRSYLHFGFYIYFCNNSYRITIVFKQINLTLVWDPNTYYKSRPQWLRRNNLHSDYLLNSSLSIRFSQMSYLGHTKKFVS